ncbi:C80 family cysteine peptidase [Endozoicomonas sp. 8E]|nr:C80 family cysteine peptidase [Endozoicomonas sp. 8E]
MPDHVYLPQSQHPYVATLKPPVKYVRGLNYDKQIVIMFNVDLNLYPNAFSIYENTQTHLKTLYAYDVNGSRLYPITGTKFIPDENTRVIFIGHGRDYLTDMSGAKVAAALTKLMPGGGKIKRISLRGCKLAHQDHMYSGIIHESAHDVYPANVLRALRQAGIITGDLTASKTDININYLGNKIYKTESDGAFVEQRKRELTRYIYQLAPDSNVVKYMLKEGLDALSPDIQQRPDLFDQDAMGIMDSDMIYKDPSIIDHQVSKEIRVSNKFLIGADYNSILRLGESTFEQQPLIIVAEPDGTKLSEFEHVIKSTTFFDEYSRWRLWLNGKLSSDSLSEIDKTTASFAHSEEVQVAYRRLAGWINRNIKFEPLDPTDHNDATILKQKYGEFAKVYLKSVPAHTLCRPGGRSRRSLGGNCRTNLDKTMLSLDLLTNDKTRIIIPELSSLDVSSIGQLGSNEFKAFRSRVLTLRLKKRAYALSSHHGYHNVVAFERELLPMARDFVQKSGKPGATYFFDGTFLKDDATGLSFRMIEGGAGNALTILCRIHSLLGSHFFFLKETSILGKQIKSLSMVAVEKGLTIENVGRQLRAWGLSNNNWGAQVLRSLTEDTIQIQVIDPDKSAIAGRSLQIFRLNDRVTAFNTRGSRLLPFFGSIRRLSGLPDSDRNTLKPALIGIEQKVFAHPLVRSGEIYVVSRHFFNIVTQWLTEALANTKYMNKNKVTPVPELSSLSKDKLGVSTISVKLVDSAGKTVTTISLKVDDAKARKSFQYFKNEIQQRIKPSTKSGQSRLTFDSLEGRGDAFSVFMNWVSLMQLSTDTDDPAALPGTKNYKRIIKMQVEFGLVNAIIDTTDSALIIGKYGFTKQGKVPASLGDRLANYLVKTKGAGSKIAKHGGQFLRLSGPGLAVATGTADIVLSSIALGKCKDKACREYHGTQISLSAAMLAPVVVQAIAAAAGASAVAAAASVIGLPLAIVVTVIMFLTGNRNYNRQRFANNMAFWQQLFDDFTLKGGWDSKTKTWNLLSRQIDDSDKTLAELEKIHDGIIDPNSKRPVRHRGILAPIREIDLYRKQITYGAFQVHKTTTNSPLLTYTDLSVPDYKRRLHWYNCGYNTTPSGSTFNFLAHPAVKAFLDRHIDWHEDAKVILLPAMKNLALQQWDNDYQNIGKTDSWKSWKGHEGFEMLWEASREATTNKPNKDFAFVFYRSSKGKSKSTHTTCWDRGLPTTGDAFAFMLKDLTNSNIIDTEDTGHVTVRAGEVDGQTFIVPEDNKMSWSFYGRSGHKFFVNLKSFAKADFYQTGDEQWVIIDRHRFFFRNPLAGLTLLNRKINADSKSQIELDINYTHQHLDEDLITPYIAPFPFEPGIRVLKFHNFNASGANRYPIIFIGSNQYPYYVLDAQAGHFKIFYPEVKNPSLTEYYLTKLSSEYHQSKNLYQSGRAINRPSRFLKVSESYWLDLNTKPTDIPADSSRRRRSGRLSFYPVAGTPSLGYLFASYGHYYLSYHQPDGNHYRQLTNLRIDGYDGTISPAIEPEAFTIHGVYYKLEAVPSPHYVGRMKPIIRPLQVTLVMDAVNLQRKMRLLGAGNTVTALIMQKRDDSTPIARGILDKPSSDDSNSMLMVWLPRTQTFLVGAVLASDAWRQRIKAALSRNNLYDTQKNDFPNLINIQRRGTSQSSRYLFTQPKGNQTSLFVIDTESIFDKAGVHTLIPDKYSLDFLNDHNENINTAYVDDANNELNFIFNSGVIVGTPLLDKEPQSRGGLISLNKSDLRIRAIRYKGKKPVFNEPYVAGLKSKLAPYVRIAKDNGVPVPPFIPVHNLTPKYGTGAEGINLKEAFIWFLLKPKRLYFTAGSFHLIDFNPDSKELFALNSETKDIVFTKATKPRMSPWLSFQVFNSDQISYENYFSNKGVLYGQDSNGDIFRIEKNQTSLTEVDIREELKSYNLKNATTEYLKESYNRILGSRLQNITANGNILLPEVLKLSDGKGLTYQQICYHTAESTVAPEGTYIFDGNDDIKFLGAKRQNNLTTEWFFSSDGLLYKQESNVIKSNFSFEYAFTKPGSNALFLKVDQSSEANVVPPIMLGESRSDTVLHIISGKSDRFDISRKMIEHYQGIIVETRVASTLSSQKYYQTSLDFKIPVNEFIASFGNQSVYLFHYPSRHSVFFPENYESEILKKTLNQNQTFSTESKTSLSFYGWRGWLSDLIRQMISQGGSLSPLPINIEQFYNRRQMVTASPDQLLILNVGDYHLTGFRKHVQPENPWCHLKFESQNKTRNIKISDPSLRAAKAGKFRLSDEKGNRIFFNVFDHRAPNRGVDMEPVWTALNSGEDQFTKPNIGNFKLFSPTSYGEVRYMSGAFTSDKGNSSYRLDPVQPWPTSLVFGWDGFLQGYPMRLMDRFEWDPGGAPEWLLTSENRFIRLFSTQGDSTATSSGHPVLYNLDSNLLKVMKYGDHRNWYVYYDGHLIRRVKGTDSALEPDFLTVTLVDQIGSNISRTRHFLALPYDFSEWVVRSHDSSSQPFSIGTQSGIRVTLSPMPFTTRGFVPEHELTGLLMAKSLNKFDGIFFNDGLKRRSELEKQLAKEPLTKITGEKQDNALLFSGNALSNIIIVDSVNITQPITINSLKGDDFIQVLGIQDSMSGSKSQLTLEEKIQSFSNQTITIDAGEGQDVLDLSAAYDGIKVVGSPGEKTIFVSPESSYVDLKQLRQWNLFPRGLASNDLEYVLVKSSENKFRTVASVTEATDAYLKKTNCTYFFARMATNNEGKGTIYFADGALIPNVWDWLNGEPVYKHLWQALAAPGQKYNLAQAQATLNSAIAYSLRARGKLTDHEADIIYSLDRLLQEIAPFKDKVTVSIADHPESDTLIVSRNQKLVLSVDDYRLTGFSDVVLLNETYSGLQLNFVDQNTTKTINLISDAQVVLRGSTGDVGLNLVGRYAPDYFDDTGPVWSALNSGEDQFTKPNVGRFKLFSPTPYREVKFRPELGRFTSDKTNSSHRFNYRTTMSLVFGWDDLLEGYPMRFLDQMIWNPAMPEWLLAPVNRFIRLFSNGREYSAAMSSGHPVLYNLDSNRLNVTKSASHDRWDIYYKGHLIRQVRTDSSSKPDYLTLTVAEAGIDDKTVYSASRFLGVPYDFSKWMTVHSKNSSSGVPFSIGPFSGIRVTLSPATKGFIPEHKLTNGSLSAYDGIYFNDGLKLMEELPLTKISGQEKDEGTFFSGNSLNNIIIANTSNTSGPVAIDSGKGDDFIQLLGVKNSESGSKGQLTLEQKIQSLSNQTISIDAGEGQDVLDLSATYDVIKVTTSPGEKTIFVSPEDSYVDLKELGQWNLFPRGLAPEGLEYILVSAKGRKLRKVTDLKEATDVFLTTVNGKNLFARLSATNVNKDKKGSIYFADGASIPNVWDWFNGQPVSKPYGVQVAEDRIDLVMGQSYHLTGMQETLNSAKAYYSEAGDTTDRADVINRLDQMVQEVATSRGKFHSNHEPFKLTADPNKLLVLSVEGYHLTGFDRASQPDGTLDGWLLKFDNQDSTITTKIIDPFFHTAMACRFRLRDSSGDTRLNLFDYRAPDHGVNMEPVLAAIKNPRVFEGIGNLLTISLPYEKVRVSISPPTSTDFNENKYFELSIEFLTRRYNADSIWPTILMYGWDVTLQGYPMRLMDRMIWCRRVLDQHDWLFTPANSAIRLFSNGQEHSAAASSGHPVLHNLDSPLLNVTKNANHNHWDIHYKGHLIRKVEGTQEPDYLTLTLRTFGETKRFLALPYDFSEWMTVNSKNSSSGVPFSIGPFSGIRVTLSPATKGFIPEHKLTNGSLSAYDGIYFNDGLKLVEQLPLTKITGQEKGGGTFFSGNVLNNIIIANTSNTSGPVAIDSGKGDDFIQLLGVKNSESGSKSQLTLEQKIQSFSNPAITIDAGAGHDVVDLSAVSAGIELKASPDKKTIFISPDSQANLKPLTQWNLFALGLASHELEYILVNSNKDGLREVTNVTEATDAYLKKPDGTHFFARMAANKEGKGTIYFADGACIKNFGRWLSGEPVSKPCKQTQTKPLTTLVLKGTALPPDQNMDDLTEVQETLKSAMAYYSDIKEKITDSETGIISSLNRLVQEMAVFKADAGGDLPNLSTTPSPPNNIKITTPLINGSS